MSAEERSAARVAALKERAEGYAVSRPFLARVWRTVARYVEVRIPRLSAFVTYYGFLALFPLSALGFAVLGILSRYLPDLDDAVTDSLTDNASSWGLSPAILDQLERAAVGLGLISLGFLLYAGVRWVEALREAVAVVFGGQPPKGRMAQRVGADLVLLTLFGLVILASVALSTVTTVATSWLTDLLGFSSETLLRATALGVSLLVTTVLLVLIMWRLAGRSVRPGPLWRGALLGAIGMEVLRSAATYIIGSSLKNPVYGVFALTIGMLIWINFAVKLLLVVAAWVAVADDEGLGTPFLGSPGTEPAGGSAGAAGSSHQPLAAAGLAAPPPHGQQGDDGPDDQEREPDPARDRPQ